MYKRAYYQTIINRLEEPRRFIQVVMGPRQVGKTTTVKQTLQEIKKPYLFFSADMVPATQNSWISDCWANARSKIKFDELNEIILVIDEIQKIKNWSEAVKKEWDDDTFNDINIKVVLLGSSRVMIEKGLSESLAGRFESIKMTHWNYREMQEAFDLNLEQYIYFGGYPGSADLIHDELRWKEYIISSIIDATINKDILINTIINKPALLRQTFELGSAYSGEILSLTKLIGTLQDAGNTTTLTGYLNLLSESGLLCALSKYSVDKSRRRASIPKFQVYNNALKTVFEEFSFKDAVRNPKVWGRIFESAIGAHIACNTFTSGYETYYWRENNYEVDYVIKMGSRMAAIEVKSNNDSNNSGLGVFREKYNPLSSIVVGNGGIPAAEFLSINPLKIL
ncbi:MAG: AAA family ATPase [Bacteroidetes bacterium HGW-Bacteroidetes-19]|nr:MAG: AAA family ATPase [Bacteroidetes bacterium HGW-Bacteroidetes-20]PKP28423.1 MAG: AAA family ATPase [Bacteroidetes bacterium HGW-Bacteroidetes-19]